jgi:protein-cysteine N-palmitoyltransferase HHAT
MNLVKHSYESNNDVYLNYMDLSDDDFYLMLISVSWIQLRCISYCLEIIRSRAEIQFIDLLSYCFYLPLLFLGPVILYDDFDKGFTRNDNKKFSNLFVNLARYFGWFLFLEISLHFFYFNAMQYQAEVNDELILRFDLNFNPIIIFRSSE